MATMVAGGAGIFLDIGANVGAYTLWAIEAGCEVIAAEPNAWALEQLRANLTLNGYHATVLQAAVTDAPGTARVTADLGVTNRLALEEDDDERLDVVQATTIDELLGDRTAHGVKVDVEGAELAVVRGAHRALSERRILLMQLEWTTASERFGVAREQIAELLDAHGYELLTPTPSGELIPVEHVGPQQPDLFGRPRAR